MGGDHGPSIVVPGVAQAAQAMPGVRFLLHGDGEKIQAELAKHPAAKAVSEIRHSDKAIGMDEKPAQAMRRGKGSSMWNAIETLREGEAQACVSAGNTGALMAISKLILRMGADLERPAIVANWPNMKGVTTVLDVGANVESDAAQLVEFAIMGAAFHHAVHGAKRPTVGLLNVGSEDQKGHEEVREAHAILREAKLDFDYHGFVEGNDIAYGTVDVVVTDGFTGCRAEDGRGPGAVFLERNQDHPDLGSDGHVGRPDRLGRAEKDAPAPGSEPGERSPAVGPEWDRGEKPWRRGRGRVRLGHPSRDQPRAQRFPRRDR